MEDLELYIKNKISNPDALMSYNYIIEVIKKLLADHKIELGDLEVDSDGNIYKKSNDINITIEKYDDNTPNHFAEVTIGNESPIVIKVNIEELKRHGTSFENSYLDSPIRFYMDITNEEKGTISIQECNLYYYDNFGLQDYIKKTNDTIPTNIDYINEGIRPSIKVNLKKISVDKMCSNMENLLTNGFDAPLAKEVIDEVEKKTTKGPVR